MNQTTLQQLLRNLSAAFEERDPEGLLRLFSSTAAVTYAGSEPGEKATGPPELRRLLTDLLARPMAYSFEFADITFSEQDQLVWLLADGHCTQTADDGMSETFPYRVTGVLAQERGQWRWLLLAGSEPAPG